MNLSLISAGSVLSKYWIAFEQLCLQTFFLFLNICLSDFVSAKGILFGEQVLGRKG